MRRARYPLTRGAEGTGRLAAAERRGAGDAIDLVGHRPRIARGARLSTADLAFSRGVADGLAALDSGGKVPSAQLPSYVDDVEEYANSAAFPGAGETGKIYVDLAANLTYRWTGTVYTEISASPGSTDAVPEGATNLYFTNARADARVVAATGDTDADLVALYTTAKA